MEEELSRAVLELRRFASVNTLEPYVKVKVVFYVNQQIKLLLFLLLLLLPQLSSSLILF